MDIFQSLLRTLTGKVNELDKPIFAKPFSERTDDLLALMRRLDSAPEESKPIFRDAVATLEKRITLHREVFQFLQKSDMPIVVLYDVHLVTAAGSATADFVILSNRFVLGILCPVPTPRKSVGPESDDGSSLAPIGKDRKRLSDAERLTNILTECLRDENVLGKKELSMVQSVIVRDVPDGEDESDAAFTAEPTAKSSAGEAFPADQTIRTKDLDMYLRGLFRMDKEMLWISNDKVFAVSQRLLRKDGETDSASASK